MTHEVLPVGDTDPTLPPLNQVQLEALDSLALAHDSGVASGYLNEATGLGKTRIAAEDVNIVREKQPDSRILYLCHNSDILMQARDTFTEVLGTHSQGNMFGGEFEDQKDIVYATFQTMGRESGGGKVYEAFDPKEFDYIVVDESHHGPAPTYRPIIEYFQPAFKLGLTATPERTDQQDIKELFGEPIHTTLLEGAIAAGHLAQPDYRLLTDHVRRLEEIEEIEKISPKQLNEKIFVKRRDAEIADMIAEHLYEIDDPRTIVFCPSIEHAEYMTDFLPGKVDTLHSKLSKDIQDERLVKFKTGELDMLVTVDKLNEGVDVPEANVLVFLRTTESRTVFLQQLGRGLRKIPGKEKVLVLDFVASWERIKMVQNLADGVSRSFEGRQDNNRYSGAHFKFDFSEEALNAIDVVQYAREKRLHKPRAVQLPERAGRLALVEAMLQAQLPQPLTSHRSKLLLERAASGDIEARQEFLLGYLDSIYKIAAAVAEGDTELTEEYFQDACLAIMEQLGNRKNYNYSYPKMEANQIAREGITRNGTDYDLLELPYYQKEILRRLDSATAKLKKNLDLEPTIEELSIETGLSEDRIAFVLKLQDANQNVQPEEALTSLNSRDDTSMEAMDVITKEQLIRVLALLPFRERQTLELRYGLGSESPRSLDEVGRIFHVTGERIRQIENMSLKKLQSLDEAQVLSEPSGDTATPSSRQALRLTERDLHNAKFEASLLPPTAKATMSNYWKRQIRQDDAHTMQWIDNYSESGIPEYAGLLLAIQTVAHDLAPGQEFTEADLISKTAISVAMNEHWSEDVSEEEAHKPIAIAEKIQVLNASIATVAQNIIKRHASRFGLEQKVSIDNFGQRIITYVG